MDKIAVTAAAVGNILEITPADGILDNSKYTIRIKGLKSADGTKILPEKVFTIVTAITPMYCTLNSLKALVDSFGVPEANLLSYIRNASREADFIAGGTAVKKGKVQVALACFAFHVFFHADTGVSGHLQHGKTGNLTKLPDTAGHLLDLDVQSGQCLVAH